MPPLRPKTSRPLGPFTRAMLVAWVVAIGGVAAGQPADEPARGDTPAAVIAS